MEYKIWIDATQQIPTADYVTNFRMLAESMHVRESADLEGLSAKDLRILAILLLNVLRDHPAGEMLHQLSEKRVSDCFWLVNAATPLPLLKRLLSGAIDQVNDEDLWKQVQRFITRNCPPTSHNGGFVANSSEHRKDVDHLMREELGQIHVGIPHLLQTFFPSSVDGLKKRSRDFFKKCKRGRIPRYKDDTWTDWPASAVEKEVFRWLKRFCKRLRKFARRSRRHISHQRRLLGTRSKSIDDYSVMRKELNVGFIDASYPKHGSKDRQHPWPQILVPGVLNCNPAADNTGEAWHDLAMCAGKVLLAQATRRFAVGFTICGTLMRVWVFDRLGGIASEQIDVNKEPVQFIEVMLGFLRMSEEDLGFDPTIKIIDGEPSIEIERNGRSECIVIDGLIIRQCCMVGRATTCWKAHVKDHPETPLVIKDSWQPSERDEEGEMLKQATSRNVVNVARYYHHETVKIGGMIDDVCHCIRRGLDTTTASNYQERLPQDSSGPTSEELPMRQTSARTSTKRPFDQTGSALPPSKKTCARSLRITATEPQNVVHRRIIVQDYGKAIYKASSRKALLACLEGCIKGHKSLHDKGILHRDISINNLMINEDQDNPSWKSFLIDLDFAISTEREKPSGAQGMTGTRAFMAIRLLEGAEHTFMHDLESFFWVLFWICVQYEGPGKEMKPAQFGSWTYFPDETLACLKTGFVSDHKFSSPERLGFTPYYQPLIPHVNKLRKEVFPGGEPLDKPFPELYSKMIKVLHKAQKDPAVLAE
ncbi:hypothetical protein E4U09_004376 [Claviceps aff. purpurea]|uniref:non-specific serine/threonine protein kinase n=1 Tax=Claviceps aff. purpurea TaxID=1967640 RepID=A0A9P7U1E8_9HYPO|nr:hypothetical protein E4U09_004376 [Claviceps aff. purpurea]